MIPEIGLLIEHFNGKIWNSESQRAFMEVLRDKDFFNGRGANDPAFSARDRINRAPKSLGFVVLEPRLQLTSAGQKLLTSRRIDEVFLRQMLKFQLPSPYHRPTSKAVAFCVKPYTYVEGLREGSLITLEDVKLTLKGSKPARIFKVGKVAWRCSPAATSTSYSTRGGDR